VLRYPSPLRALGERIRVRRGAGIATVAVARKLVVLFWHPLTKQQDYPFGRPSLTRKKLRQLELAAGAARGKGEPGVWGANKALREAELELARQAETAYRRLVSDWQPKGARARHRDAHLQGRQAPSSAARHRSQTLRFSSSPRHPELSQGAPKQSSRNLTYIRRALRRPRLLVLLTPSPSSVPVQRGDPGASAVILERAPGFAECVSRCGADHEAA
jgi:hypothetical protein